MTGRRTHHAHSQYAGEGLNANPSLSGAGSAVDSAPTMDHLPELDDFNSPHGLQEMPPSPRTVPPMQDFSSFSYQDSDFVSSNTLTGYQLSSHSHPAFNPFSDHLQSSGPLGGADQTGPWNPLPASGTPQELPIHTKSGGPPAVRTPMRGSEVSTIPPDSGYRSSSQYETQSHLSTPDLNQSGEMDPFIMNPHQTYPDLASPFQEHEQGGSQGIEINTQHPQETIQEEQTEQTLRPDLLCSDCGHESKTPSDAKKHMMRHTKPYKCKHPGCSRQLEGFSTRNDLVRHTSSVHGTGGGKVWYCMAPGCQKPEKPWPRLDNFKQHLIRMHSECDVDDLVRLAEQRPEFLTGDNETQDVINNEIHKQEYNIRQAEEQRQADQREAEQRRKEQRQARRRPSAASTYTSTDSRQKRARPDEDFPDFPDPRRVRPNVPALDTAATLNSIPSQNRRFLSPHSPNVPPNHNAFFGRDVTTMAQVRRQRPAVPQRQSDSQQLLSHQMGRSLSQQEPSSRRHTVGNGHQALNPWQQYTPMVSNFSATQQLHLSPEDTRSAYEDQWNAQAQFTMQHYPHTVAGDANWDLLQNDPMFAYPSYSTAELPPTDDVLGDLARATHPSSQQPSLSPTITSNNPRTPSSSTPTVTPTVMMTLEHSQTPQDDIADISKLLKGLGDYKHLSKAVGNNPFAQQELSKLLKDPSRSTVKSEASSAQGPSRESAKGHHQRQISCSSDATHSAAESSPTAPPQAIKSVTQAAAKRAAANKPNATCLECGKAVGRESDLKKHMKRHTKPYGCVWDGCSKAFGSKNDWKRHESTHAEAEGGWRCDGQHGAACQAWQPLDSSRPYEENMQQYAHHLLASGVPAHAVPEAMGRCFIPKGHKGAFWCGFCDFVVQLAGEEGTFTEQRISHIDRHFMKDEPARHHSQWKDCDGNGRTKQVSLGVAPPAAGDHGDVAE